MFEGGVQFPMPLKGAVISGAPDDVTVLYNEIRRIMQVGAYTSAVLAARKLLAHVAVDKGADSNLKFFQYIDYLVDNHWVPANAKPWVDEIRQLGNQATHEIVIVTPEQAEQILDFAYYLLVFMYELKARLEANKKADTNAQRVGREARPSSAEPQRGMRLE